jgi:hypothetical protein
MGRFIDWLLHRHKPVLTGIYHSGTIFPHVIHPPVLVCARAQKRLQDSDRVEFVAVEAPDGVPEARRVKVYRRPERR